MWGKTKVTPALLRTSLLIQRMHGKNFLNFLPCCGSPSRTLLDSATIGATTPLRF
jgi:hypothetical protein